MATQRGRRGVIIAVISNTLMGLPGRGSLAVAPNIKLARCQKPAASCRATNSRESTIIGAFNKKMSEKDIELKDLIQSLFPDYDHYRDGGETVANLNNSVREMTEMLQRRVQNMRESVAALPSVRNNPDIASIVNDILEREVNDLLSSANLPEEIPDPNRSKLSNEKRAEIKRLVDAGASLNRIDALHLAASHYKQRDLFDLLIDEYGLGIEDPDHDSLLSPPLTVAACLGNCEAIEILLAKGADKKSRNSRGRTALQEVKYCNRQTQRGMPDVMFEQFRRQTNVDRVTSLLS